MADIPLDLIIAVGQQTEIKSLASDVALTASSVGNHVVVSNQGTAFRSLRTPPEASLVAGFEVNQVTNGDSTNACLVFSNDWKSLHAKLNTGGSLKIGFVSANTYAYYDKTSLASATQYDRESDVTLHTMAGTPLVAEGHAAQIDTNLYVVTYAVSITGGNKIYAVALQYDTTASVWRVSSVLEVASYGGPGNSGYARSRVVKGSTSKAVIVMNRNNSSNSNQQNRYGIDARVYDVTAGVSPSAPTFTATATASQIGQGFSNISGPSWTLTNFAVLLGQNWDVVMPNSTTMYISCASITTVSGGTTLPADTSTNYFSGVIKASVDLTTGASTFSATYSWIAGVDRVRGRMCIDTIPGTTKAVICGSRMDQSDKVQVAVFTGTAYGTTIDAMSHTGVTTIEDSISVVCPDVAKAVVTYRNGTASTTDGSHNRLAARSISVTESTNTLVADGTEVELCGGRRVSRTKPITLSTSSVAYAMDYNDIEILTAGMLSETVETYDISGTDFTLRSDMNPGPFIRKYGPFGFIFPVDLVSSPKKFAYLCTNLAMTSLIGNHFYEDGSGNITQMLDGSVMGGWARTS